MTNQQPPETDSNPQPLSFSDKVVGMIQKPHIQIVSLVTITVVAVAGYEGSKYLAKIIPLRLETELERVLDRNVNLGEISSFSFNEVIIENLEIPATEKDSSFLEIDAVKIRVGIWSTIINRSLTIDVIANDITGYAQLDTLLPPPDLQKPLPNSLKLPPLPIPITANINLRLQNSKISVTPDGLQKVAEVKTKGNLRLIYDNDTQPLDYQLENTINGINEINLKGKILLSNTESENQLEINYLSLPDIAYLIPQLPLDITEGRLNGKLDLVTSSLPEFQATKINGNINLEDIEGKINLQKVNDNKKITTIPLLGKNFTFNASVDIEEKSLNIVKSKFSLGELNGSIKGNIHQEEGYNLQGNLNQVSIKKILPSLAIKLPLPIDGLMTAYVTMAGNLDNPQIQGKVKINNSLIDKIELGNIDSQFIANVDNIAFKKIIIKPPTGGEILSQGVINTNFRQPIIQGKSIEFQTIPFNFKFTANLPSSELIKSYEILPQGINIGSVLATGEIKGNVNQPQGLVSFSFPNIKEENLGILSATGNLTINKQAVNLIDTELVVKENRLTVNGSSNWQEKTWQVNLVSDDINLTPFLPQFCERLSSCQNSQVNLPIVAKNVDVSLRGNRGEEVNLNTIQGDGKVKLIIDDGNLKLNSTLVNGNLIINGKASEISVGKLFPSFALVTQIVNSDIKIIGDIEELLKIPETDIFPNSLKIVADSQLRIEKGLINAVASIDNQKTEITADVSQISINKIIPSFSGVVNSSLINVTAKTTELYSFFRQPFNYQNFANINSLNLMAKVNGNLAGGYFNTEAKINNGLVFLQGITEKISLSQLFPNIKTKNFNTNISLTSNLSELLSFSSNYLENQTFSSFPSLNIRLDSNFDIAKGRVLVTTKVKDNQWQSQINTQNINLDNLNQQLAFVKDNSQVNLSSLDKVNSKINLSGNLSPLLNQTSFSLPINLPSAMIESGKNSIQAKGKFNLVNLFTKPDVNNIQLQVTANSNLNVIPVNQLFSSLSKDKGINFFPSSVNLDGKVKFQGFVNAQNLLTNLLGKNNLNIEGNLTLNNLNFNQLEFESFLTGKLRINPSQKIIMDLRGKEDVIAVSFVKESLSIPKINLTLPYTPDSLEITKGRNSDFSLQGKRQGKEFFATINNFALENLQLKPAINYGINGKIQGNLATNIVINLTDFSANGNLTLDNLGIGNLIARQFTTNFNFQNDTAQLNNGRLNFAKTKYDLMGKINFATQDIEGKINLQGNVEDIFSTLKITDVATLTSLVKQLQNQNELVSADNIPPQSLGKENDTIKTKVNLLYSIDKQIKAMAKQIELGKIPNDLDITGGYQGEILLGGKFTNPEINFGFEGKNWQWLPHQNFPNIVDSLGLIMQKNQVITIPKIAFDAKFKNNNLSLQPFILNLANSEIFFTGNLSLEKQEGEFKLKDFPLDFITAFFPTSVDVESLINLDAKISGSLLNPQIIGNLSLNNTAVDGAIIDNQINANFNYDDYQLNLTTEENSNIKLNAIIPYHPFVTSEKPALINVKLDDKNMALLGLLTQGKLQLTGGNFNTDLTLYLASTQNFNLQEIEIGGNINFDNTEVKSNSLNQPFYLSGNINLLKEKQAINVENLSAKINNSNVDINGILPLFKPITNNDNILTVNINNQALQLKDIYSGKIDGNITINGTIINPEIGGYLGLNNGNFNLPSTPQNPSSSPNQLLWSQWLSNPSSSTSGIFQPKLTDFSLKLENTELARWGLYRFLFGGDLTLNGGLLEPQNIRANGAINLRRGQIYLGGTNPLATVTSNLGFGQTTFFLSLTNNNSITFDPNENILNPDIDIELQADIVDYSRQLPNTQRNEISEPIIRGGRGDNIQVVLKIDGGLSQLLPVLSNNVNNYCRLPVSTPIAENTQLSPSQLNKVSECVNLAMLNQQGSNLNLLNSPLVSLSSIPNRSQGELINLIIGGQLLNLATQLQDLSGQQLFENGLAQFILVPLANNISFGVNETVSSWGKPLGMKDLRVFPLVEGVYKVKDESTVSVSYDYIYGEFKVRYQMRF